LRSKGNKYESIAVQYLKEKGYSILERNFHCGRGEIDIVAFKDGVLVFVEVKGGTTEEFGHPVDRLTRAKFLRILECAYRFMEKQGRELPFRIDLITVFRKKIQHYENVSLL